MRQIYDGAFTRAASESSIGPDGQECINLLLFGKSYGASSSENTGANIVNAPPNSDRKYSYYRALEDITSSIDSFTYRRGICTNLGGGLPSSFGFASNTPSAENSSVALAFNETHDFMYLNIPDSTLAAALVANGVPTAARLKMSSINNNQSFVVNSIWAVGDLNSDFDLSTSSGSPNAPLTDPSPQLSYVGRGIYWNTSTGQPEGTGIFSINPGE